MSRSYRKPIIKDKPRNQKRTSLYWRRVRHILNSILRFSRNLEELELPNPKTIVNQYDYCDYIFRNCEDKYKRK